MPYVRRSRGLGSRIGPTASGANVSGVFISNDPVSAARQLMQSANNGQGLVTAQQGLLTTRAVPATVTPIVTTAPVTTTAAPASTVTSAPTTQSCGPVIPGNSAPVNPFCDPWFFGYLAAGALAAFALKGGMKVLAVAPLYLAFNQYTSDMNGLYNGMPGGF